MMKIIAKRARSGNWWARQARAAFSDRLALKVTAVALAVVLWFSVSVREPAEQIVTVRFLPSLESGLTLQHPPVPIRALVRGSGRDILKLYSTPPAIRMSVGGDAGDSISLPIRPTDVEMPPGVVAQVRDVQPRRITLTFARGRSGRTGGGSWARPTSSGARATSPAP